MGSRVICIGLAGLVGIAILWAQPDTVALASTHIFSCTLPYICSQILLDASVSYHLSAIGESCMLSYMLFTGSRIALKLSSYFMNHPAQPHNQPCQCPPSGDRPDQRESDQRGTDQRGTDQRGNLRMQLTSHLPAGPALGLQGGEQKLALSLHAICS